MRSRVVPQSVIARQFRFVRLWVMLALMLAASAAAPDFPGGDGLRMASVGPRLNLCLVGGSGESRGQDAYVRTVAAGFTSAAEPAAGVLFAGLAFLAALRRRPRWS
jgi:hypothetical protein